jgi:ABC-2 type transport system permease protein
MKALYIALKDLVRSFRSAFLLTMMFVAPLLLTGLIYFAFGSMGNGLELPVTHTWVVNLDQAGEHSGFSAGQLLADYLQDENLTNLLQVTTAPDEASARAAVERQQADVAIIIPPGLTAAAMNPDDMATVVLYHDPTLTVQPGIVRVIVSDFLDGFSGVKIALQVTAKRLAANGLPLDPPTIEQIEQRYVAWVQSSGGTHHADSASAPVLVTRPPLSDGATANLQTTFLGPVMAGMMVFFVFFTGAAGASSIIHEDEDGTLARLFTTPTRQVTILGGKCAAIFLTLAVQAAALMLASHFAFDIHWGEPLTIALVTLALVVAASGFGVFLMSLIKTTRQTGPVMGGVLSVMGLLSGLFPTGDPSKPSVFDKIGLALPQGWAIRGWKLALGGAEAGEVLLPVAVLLSVGLALFLVGLVGFRKRFA